MEIIEKTEYSKLAEIYDALMHDVNYELWADFIDALILEHHPDPHSLLEMACGTGTLSLLLDELGYYEVTGGDKSPEMIEKARKKNEAMHCNVDFQVMDFLDINFTRKFDVVVSVFDSINYLLSPQKVLAFLKQTKKVLKPGSLLIFDFTTPKNSVQAVEYLHNEEGYTGDNHRFFRKSTYNAAEQMHQNEFRIEKLADDQETVIKRFREVHHQKIYTLRQMLDIIDQTTYKVCAKYSGFDFDEADENSLRITMVLQCPSIQL
ncbi:MAG TPA: class I SAM-dependent methyltransferase [Balneolaceae bacterium]|nr:class I SAM-dependent methyltransferase [Balneolaceae bacterium]